MGYMSTQQSDPLPHNSPSSPSFSSTTGTATPASHSDEEALLATSRPKKRAGRRVFKETRHPIYRGVRRRNNNKWVCELREPNKKTRIWLGTYPTPEMAARAHDVAALALRGKSACLNFADSSWRLPVPASNHPKDITKAAAEAAEGFRPRDQLVESTVSDEETMAPMAAKGCTIEEEKLEEEAARTEKIGWFIDEEELFDMPGLLSNMAEGLLLSPPPPPPPLVVGYDDVDEQHINWDDMATLPLWSFSF